jgi:hypothetical protein
LLSFTACEETAELVAGMRKPAAHGIDLQHKFCSKNADTIFLHTNEQIF